MVGLDLDVDNSNVLWFVSASSLEWWSISCKCGQRNLKRKNITGGGRIDYCVSKEISHAHGFGFSCGFGKGNHELVASSIKEFTDAIPTYNNSDNLY